MNTGATAAVGLVFWAVAAHLFSHQVLGRSSALVAALILVSTFAQLNLANTLPRFLPRAGRRAGRLILYCYGASAVAALAGSLVFVIVLPRLSSQWDFLGQSLLLCAAFVAATVVWGIFSLEDSVLLSVRRPMLVPVENGAYGVSKLLILAGTATLLPAVGIFVSWVIPLVVIVPVINLLIFGRFLKERDTATDVARVRPQEVLRFASLDYVGAIFGQAYGNLLPLIVLSVLGPIANGNFYVAWSIAAGLQLVAANFATSLLVEGSAAPDRLAELTRGILVRCLLATTAGAAVLVVGAPLILRIYGHEYAVHAASVLALLAVGSIPLGLVYIAISLDRISGRMGRAVLTRVALAVLALGGTWLLLGRLGIVGVGAAWLGAHLVVATVRLPTIVAAIRRHPAVASTPDLDGLPAAPDARLPERPRGTGLHRRPATSPRPATGHRPVTGRHRAGTHRAPRSVSPAGSRD